eukprot:6021194-Heterocapsa_arctica.AAC.1
MSEKSKKKPASSDVPVKETKKKRVASPKPSAQSPTPSSTSSLATNASTKDRDVTKGTPSSSPSAHLRSKVPTTWATSTIGDILKGKDGSMKATAAMTP